GSVTECALLGRGFQFAAPTQRATMVAIPTVPPIRAPNHTKRRNNGQRSALVSISSGDKAVSVAEVSAMWLLRVSGSIEKPFLAMLFPSKICSLLAGNTGSCPGEGV